MARQYVSMPSQRLHALTLNKGDILGFIILSKGDLKTVLITTNEKSLFICVPEVMQRTSTLSSILSSQLKQVNGTVTPLLKVVLSKCFHCTFSLENSN